MTEPDSPDVAALLERAQVLLIQPGDHLVISNAGDVNQDDCDALRDKFAPLDLGSVIVFSEDIDLAVLRKTTGQDAR